MTTAAAPKEQSWLQGFEPVLLHAVLMIIGWGFFLNIGAAAARYLRKRPSWFKLHAALQTIGSLCVIAGFVVIVVMVSAQQGRHFHGVHQVAGICTIIIMVFQSILGIVIRARWVPGQRPASLEKWHWLLGKFSLIVGIGNIGTGVMQAVKEGHKPGYILYSFLGAFYLIIFLVISATEVYLVSDDERWAPSVIQRGESDPLIGFKTVKKRPGFFKAYAALMLIVVVGLCATIYKDLP